jgi:hypothetical protein
MLGAWPAMMNAQARKKNSVSKIYIADVNGGASIDTGEALEDLNKRSVYPAQGTVIETKRPTSEQDRSKHYSTMVYSNGTGAFFDADTRVEVKRFVQEPFMPNRTDVQVEPSVSHTQAFIARGAVGLCTSKLIAGSNMVYQTPHGSVNIRGQKIVIEATADETKISMLEGESTVRGASDIGGETLKAGQQAIIRRAARGEPSHIEIRKIPPAESPQLDDKVAMACLAKKTVYFEERVRSVGSSDSKAEAEGPGTSESSTPGDSVTAFDGTASGTVRDIVPVEIVPINLPTEYTVSPSRLTAPSAR